VPEGAGKLRRRGAGEAGAALVEFALLVPFLALLVFGTIDLGRVFSQQNRLRNAAREGGLYAQYFPTQVTNTGACTDPNNITYKALQEDSGAASNFSVSVTNADAGSGIAGCRTVTVSPGTHVKVTAARANFPILTPFIGAFIGNSVTLHGTAEVVVQG
jgi:Flp pilus assembly protein TadG